MHVLTIFSFLVCCSFSDFCIIQHSRTELDPRTRMDHREYFEVAWFSHTVVGFHLMIRQIPSLLFATLCYAFWLSFAHIGAPSITPYIWPLVWLGFTAIVMFDPFNFFFKSSRYWLIKSILKLLASGTRRVEVRRIVFRWRWIHWCSTYPSSLISGWGQSLVFSI